MRPGEPFEFFGQYRVQSKRISHPSRLAGCWAILRTYDPDSATINALLRSDPQWRGEAVVGIRPAFIGQRAGEFANEPDILYKRSHFYRADGSNDMPCDIIDVRKAAARWTERRRFASRLLGQETAMEVEDTIGDVQRIAALEYYVHEAGHCVGYDTISKYQDGYFQLRSKTVWPLVYLEEFRADLLAFGFAASLLPPHTAAAVFLYNVLLRLGSHIEGVEQRGQHPYGAIPFLLYALLRRTGFFILPASSKSGSSLRIKSIAADDIVQHMHSLDVLARAELVEPTALSGTDAALRAATFYRSLLDQNMVDEFDGIVGSS